jgi:uncharacterized protein YbjT (DUF2867 family)
MNRGTTLVVGATGATGQLLVEQLLQRGVRVRAVARPASRLPEHLDGREGLTVVPLEISQATEEDLAQLVAGCDAIASCLGHRFTDLFNLLKVDGTWKIMNKVFHMHG